MSEAIEVTTPSEPIHIDRPTVAVDVVIFSLLENTLQVLLIRRSTPPYRGMWAVPGSFVRTDESLEAAAFRTLQEKTGFRNVYLEQLYTFGDIDRDPRTRVISVTYFALMQPDMIQSRESPDAETAWHNIYDLPPLAFDHKLILDYALKRLRYKLEYSAVAFELMPDEFTLRELQDAYMVILDNHRLDKANFRKRLRQDPPIVEPTGEARRTKGRPAALYRFRDDAKREVKARRLFP